MIRIEINNGRMTDKQVAATIMQHLASEDRKKYFENEDYLAGKNPTIYRQVKREDAPDNRVPVPYGRKISITTKNYMFSRLIQYHAEDSAYLESLSGVNEANAGDKKAVQIGRDLIVHGVAYKLFYTDANESARVLPRYAVVRPCEVIPIYSYDIEPVPQAVIRYYQRTGETDYRVEVYYADISQEGRYSATDGYVPGEEKPHAFEGVPYAIYADNEPHLGVFDGVKPIIDAIDVIVSSDMNEVQKFELAYLVLKGQKIDKKDLDDIKKKRVFELDKDSAIAYLTKTIDAQFNGSVLSFLVDQIHKQSGVPDFDSKEFSAESSLALRYKLMGFENIASDIESVFIDGEMQSIRLINKILFREGAAAIEADKDKRIWIEMTRNLPLSTLDVITAATGMKNAGVSQESVTDSMASVLPVDVETELARQKGQKEAEYAEFLKMRPEEPRIGEELDNVPGDGGGLAQ